MKIKEIPQNVSNRFHGVKNADVAFRRCQERRCDVFGAIFFVIIAYGSSIEEHVVHFDMLAIESEAISK